MLIRLAWLMQAYHQLGCRPGLGLKLSITVDRSVMIFRSPEVPA